MAGLHLDEAQQFVIVNSMGERPDGKWAAFEVGVEEPRQNGKGGLLEARELAGLFLLGERLLIHSAHEFATADEALGRMDQLLEANPDLSRHVKAIKRSHGQEGVYLTNGQRLRYKTRTKGSGRGFSADWVGLDEAMVLPETFLGALMFTVSARANPQIWYTGSAVDQAHMEDGLVFARLRERALAGEDPSLAYFGWSAPYDTPGDVPTSAAQDPEVWAQANPALGDRITVEHVANEQRSMDARTFAVERLGVGDWPRVTGDDGGVISVKSWLDLVDLDSAPVDSLVFAFDVSPDRGSAAVCVAGRRDDGLAHVEVMEHKRGTGWVVDWLVERVRSARPTAVVCAGKSPAAALVTALANVGVDVQSLNTGEEAEACGHLVDHVNDRTLRHLGTTELVTAIRGGVKRPIGDAWAWSRKSSGVDICPLVACTLALWKLQEATESVYESRGLLTI